MLRSTTIWNTDLINENLKKLRYGAPIDLGAFYERDPELKAGNILFQLSHEEEEEFIKCSTDISHFVETHCKFLTDAGRTTVALRDYQEDILNTLGEETWMDEIEDFGPVVRNFILMAARQSGKCFFNSKIVLRNKETKEVFEIPINLFYFISKENLTFLEKVKFKLMQLYEKINNWEKMNN